MTNAQAITEDEARALVASRLWHHRFEIFPGVMTPGEYEPDFLLNKLALPHDLTGKRVLDIGAANGYFARELHKRGADVHAVDYRDKTATGFAIMEQLYGKPIPFSHANIYDLPDLGTFDYVLCLGVIYHLPDIARALDILYKLMRPGGVVFVESYVEDFGVDVPLARYIAADELNDDLTNFWAPNVACIKAQMKDVGFEVQEPIDTWGDRCLVRGVTGERSKKYDIAYIARIQRDFAR